MAPGAAPATASNVQAEPSDGWLLDPSRSLRAPFELTAEDLLLRFEQGTALAFLIEGRPSGLVFVGRGTLHFAPPILSEQRQVQLFSGATALHEAFESALVALHPAAFARTMPATWREPPPPDLLERAGAILGAEATAFATPGSGSWRPQPGDFRAELRSRRFGRLAYLRIASHPEDVLLLDRERQRRVAVYPSRAHRAAWGFLYGDQHGIPFSITHTDLELDLDPRRQALEARARLRLRAIEECEFAELRLDPGLVVEQITSSERGAHAFLQRPPQRLLVAISPALPAGGELVLEARYRGWVKPQPLIPDVQDDPSLGGLSSWPGASPSGATAVTAVREGARSGELLLYSNRVFWYPRSSAGTHATATLRVNVPRGFAAVAAGVPERAAAADTTFVFRAERPVRYLSLLVAGLTPSRPISGDGTAIRVLAAPSRARAAESMTEAAHAIHRFFSARFGEAPFPTLTLALVESGLPAGHSPAYLAILGEPPDFDLSSMDDDAAYYREDPLFFLAHEVAHQWWGQAVGWRNYREQWLSEALSQYSAALYIHHARGEAAFAKALRWMRRWALEAAGKGPISLGVRAGEVVGGPSLRAAIVYDRGALVLHMLRGVLGDAAFFRGLQSFYERWAFRSAGTDDLREALEDAAGRPLEGFFERWVRDDGVPEVQWSATPVVVEGKSRLRLVLQQAEPRYELPLSLTIEYEDHASSRTLLRLAEPRQEFLLDLEGRLRRLRLDEHGSLCRLHEQRPPLR